MSVAGDGTGPRPGRACGCVGRTTDNCGKENKMAKKSGNGTGEKVRTSVGFGFGGLLEGIQKLVEAAAKLKDSGEVNQSGEFTVPGLGEKGKGIFGFSVRTMTGGDRQGVKVQPFGNIHRTKEGLAVEEDREPLVDVFEEGDRIRVIAEMPGVSESDVAYEISGDILTISTKGDRPYHAEVLLPGRVEKTGVAFSCRNGIVELGFRRAKA